MLKEAPCLSRVEIPWGFARNSYDLHRQLWRLFPGEKKETRSSSEELRQGFLFHIEDNPTGRPAHLLVQSRRAPKTASGIVLVGTREFNPSLLQVSGWHSFLPPTR